MRCRRRRATAGWGVILVWLVTGAAAGSAESTAGICRRPAPEDRLYGFELIASHPHDPQAFTQGLVFHQGILYESTGLWGQSTLRRVALETGIVEHQYRLPDHLFGEGLSQNGDRLIQLTWRAGVGIVYALPDLKPLSAFRYAGEGWGLTHDGSSLVMSDGGASLRILDPETFAEQQRLPVRDHCGPVANLNELEYVNGLIFANVWRSDYVAVIEPMTGRVHAWLNLAPLRGLLQESANADVLNGIAYDAARDRLFVTGKNWPRLFEIRLLEDGPPPAPGRPDTLSQ